MTSLSLSVPRAAGDTAWRRHGLAVAGAWAALLLVFHRDAGAMATIWWTSDAYQHCLALPPILAWLVWLRRDALAAIVPQGWAVPLLWVAAGAAAWLVGEAAAVAGARQLALIIMLQGVVATLLGRQATAVLLFPLGYALFLVPAGDVLMPPLQTLTARMCMALLRLAHVPAALDGVFITTPGGWFKVAEACSGAKFLIAMVALGVLVAQLGFARWRRRLAFLALCVVVPVLANGVRAFATILVAQSVGAARASGFDHIVYGWIFFAVVIALVLALAWRFFDRAPDGTVAVPPRGREAVLPLPTALGLTLAIAGAAPMWSMAAAGGTMPPPATVAVPDVPGWSRIAASASPAWRPRYDGADRLLTARYRDPGGAVVDLAVALYARQDETRALVGYGRGAVDPAGPWSWAEDRAAPDGWAAERIVAPGPASRVVWITYDVGGTRTASAAAVKLATLRRHLVGGDQRAAALLVSSDARDGGEAAVARFATALGDPAAAIDRIAAGW